jgi:hypothetical protein
VTLQMWQEQLLMRQLVAVVLLVVAVVAKGPQ